MHTQGPKHDCLGQLAIFVKTKTSFMISLSETKTRLRAYCSYITIHVLYLKKRQVMQSNLVRFFLLTQTNAFRRKK